MNKIEKSSSIPRPPLPEQALSRSTYVWHAIKKRLKEQLDKDAFTTWIEPLAANLSQPKEIKLIVPNPVFYQGFYAEFMNRIYQCKDELGFDDVAMQITAEMQTTLSYLSAQFMSARRTSISVNNVNGFNRFPKLNKLRYI